MLGSIFKKTTNHPNSQHVKTKEGDYRPSHWPLENAILLTVAYLDCVLILCWIIFISFNNPPCGIL